MRKSKNGLTLAALAIWWIVPALLTMGTPGYAVVILLLGALLGYYLSIRRNPISLALWLPLIGLSGVAAMTVLLAVAWLAMLLTGSGAGAGPWVAALIMVYAGPTLTLVGIVLVPLFILLLWKRPAWPSASFFTICLINTCMVGIVIGAVLRYHRGDFYLMTKPKLVKVTHFPPITPEEKNTVRWLDQIKAAGSGVEYGQPIDFYGIAMDQNGDPLPDVQIKYATSPSESSGAPDKVLTSGLDGRFQLTGLHGIELGIMAYKQGYWKLDPAQAMDNFWFLDYRKPGFYVPDPAHPAVFTFQKILPAEPLYSWHGIIALQPDDSKIYLDPVSGRAGTTSILDLPWVTLKSVASPDQSGFVVTIGMAGPGGILKIEPGLDFLAPASEYQPVFQSSILTLYSIFDLPVYFKTHDGRYGTLIVTGYLSKKFGPQLTYSMRFNPSGSRVLLRSGPHINLEETMSQPNGNQIHSKFLGFWKSQVSSMGEGIWLKDDGTGYHGYDPDTTVHDRRFFWIQESNNTILLDYFSWQPPETVETYKYDETTQSLVIAGMYRSADLPALPGTYKRKAP